LCQKLIPIVVVVTGLEDEEPEMESWWSKNQHSFAKYGMVFDGHACVTTAKGKKTAKGYRKQEEYDKSKTVIEALITSQAVNSVQIPKDSKGWLDVIRKVILVVGGIATPLKDLYNGVANHQDTANSRPNSARTPTQEGFNTSVLHGASPILTNIPQRLNTIPRPEQQIEMPTKASVVHFESDTGAASSVDVLDQKNIQEHKLDKGMTGAAPRSILKAGIPPSIDLPKQQTPNVQALNDSSERRPLVDTSNLKTNVDTPSKQSISSVALTQENLNQKLSQEGPGTDGLSSEEKAPPENLESSQPKIFPASEDSSQTVIPQSLSRSSSSGSVNVPGQFQPEITASQQKVEPTANTGSWVRHMNTGRWVWHMLGY